MADTARPASEAKEYFDPPEVLDAKVTRLAEFIRESSHMIAFTGAGISTACGIPDFRSGMGTVLTTGPGVWELRAQKQERATSCKTTSTLKAIPSYTHMMLNSLQRAGALKFLVSQNTDGLHRRSGFPTAKLAELHGNSNLEKCQTCKKTYLRDFRTRNAHGVKEHDTGRKCDDPKCRGKLHDTIINFGENLPEYELTESFRQGRRADLCLAMGSSLTVTPAADIPQEVGEKRGGRLVIVNLQKTPLDGVASLIIHAKCDDVSRLLAQKLGLHVQTFALRKQVKLTLSAVAGGKFRLQARGCDADGTPFSLVTCMRLRYTGSDADLASNGTRGQFATEEPTVQLPSSAAGKQVTIRLYFSGNYSEPHYDVTWTLPTVTGTATAVKDVVVFYNPITRVWATTPEAATGDDSKTSEPVPEDAAPAPVAVAAAPAPGKSLVERLGALVIGVGSAVPGPVPAGGNSDAGHDDIGGEPTCC